MAHPGGRPTKYTPELADRICEAVATSDQGLDHVCEQNPEFPVESVIRLWRFKHPEFSTKYLQAKQFQAELYAESTLKIADVKSTFIDGDGNKRIDPGYVAWQKMNVNLRQWHASKLAPKVYGDKKTEENNNPLETLTKIHALVADLNKTNVSDI